MEITPVPVKSRADHTDRVLASQDCVITVYIIDFTVIISVQRRRLWSNRRTAAAGIMAVRVAALRAAWLGCCPVLRAAVFGGPLRQALSGHDPKVNPRQLRPVH